MTGTRAIGDGIPAQVTQVKNVGTMFVAAAFLAGLYLLVSGLVRLFRKGEAPRRKRYRPMARIALGAFLVAVPAIAGSIKRASQPGLPISNAQGF